MHRIDHPTNSLTLPTPSAAGTPGYFQPGNPSLGLSGTVITTDWANAIQEEMANVVTAGGLVLSKTSNTQMLDALDARFAGVSAGVGGFRNAIINGGFDIWQRGTSFSNPGNTEHVADRWRVIWTGTGATRTISRVVPTTASALSGRSPVLRWAQTAAGTGGTLNSLTQRIEGAGTFAGRTVTVSWVQQSTSTITMPSVQLQQIFGTGGSPSGAVTVAVATSNSVTTTQVRRSFTVALPAVTSSVFGTNGDDYLMLRFNLPLNAVFSVDITQVQVESGAAASPFEYRDQATEFGMCARYFETNNPTGAHKTFAANDGASECVEHTTANFRARIPFRFPKRVTPSITYYDAAGTANRVSYFAGSWMNGGAISVGPGVAVGGFFMGHNIASSVETQFGWQADAEI